MTIYTIPSLDIPGHVIPRGYQQLTHMLLEAEPNKSIFSILSTDDHPTRLALMRGEVKAAVFEHKTGYRRAIRRREWEGSERWLSLQLDTIIENGAECSIIARPKATSVASEDPIARLLVQIDAAPNFPWKLRRVVELYYGHDLHLHRPHLEKTVADKFENEPWDPAKPNGERIRPSYAKFIALLTNPEKP